MANDKVLVKFKGASFEERIIHKQHLSDVYNIDVPEDLHWFAGNYWTLDATDWAPELMEIINAHPEFVVLEGVEGIKAQEDAEAKVAAEKAAEAELAKREAEEAAAQKAEAEEAAAQKAEADAKASADASRSGRK